MKKEFDQNLNNYYSPLSGQSVPIRFDPESNGFYKYKGLIKFIILNIVNLGLVIVILFLINVVNKKAANIKNLHNQVLLNREKTNVAVLEADLKMHSDKIDNLEKYYLDDERILDLIKKTDELKVNGLITKFDILSQKPVKDGKMLGYPVEFEIVGNKELVNNSLKQIESLNFLYKTAQLVIDLTDENQIKMLLGIFIYAKN